MHVQTRRRSMPPDPAVGATPAYSGDARPAPATFSATGPQPSGAVYGAAGAARPGATYGAAGDDHGVVPGPGGGGRTGTTYGSGGGQQAGTQQAGTTYGSGVYGSAAAGGGSGGGPGGDDGDDGDGPGGGSGGGSGRWRGRGPRRAKPAGAKPAKTKRADPMWAKLTIVFGAVLMMASGGAIVGSKMLIGRYTENISTDTLIATDAGKNKGGDGKALDGAINILLLGVDERARNKGDVRSDTIIVLHIPETHDQAYLVSIPRDTYVNVPAFKKSGYAGGRSKITDAFHAGAQGGAGRAGGAQLVSKIINNLTGIEFDGAAIIDFNGFKRVIDALDGVTMCVDHQVSSQHMRLVNGKVMWLADARKYGGGSPVVHKKGCRKMEGWEALDYSRQRYGLPKGDYDRQRHQQQLIKAMAKQAMSKGVITDLGKLDRVIKAAGSAFILDTGGVAIADFIFTLKGVAANDLVLVKTNGGDFNGARVDGTSAEQLSPESLEMFGAVKNGTLAEWLISHPTFISKDK